MKNNAQKISAIILAGGKSQRIGFDKAFLLHDGVSFISLISEEALKVADEVLVIVGKKPKEVFRSVLPDERVTIIEDGNSYLENPLGGILAGLSHAKNEYAVVLACDSPLVRSEVIRFLCDAALNHVAAVPMWDDMRIEPLCAAYNVREAQMAGHEALQDGKIGPKHMVSYLRDVRYVHVSELRTFDPELDSLLNINTIENYLALEARNTNDMLPLQLAKLREGRR